MTSSSAVSSSSAGRGLSVACVHVSSALGGSERVLLDFASRARHHDIAATVVLPKAGPLEGALRESGVRVRIAPAPEKFLELSQRVPLSASALLRFGGGLARWSRAIAEALERIELTPGERPAVLYSNGFKAHLACALLRGYRRAWHLHEFPPQRVGPAWKLLLAAVPDAAIANSRAVARAWRGLGANEPEVVYYGVDLERFRPDAKTYWIHDLLALPRAARLIAMPAVFARWKGQLLVVDAFERVAEHLPDAHLVFVGGPIYDTVAERGYAEELVGRVGRASDAGGLSHRAPGDRIHFVRFQEDPWRVYPECEVVVHFSTRPEPFGRVLIEAAACGVPVIAARAGGPTEIVEHGVTGWLIPPGDVAALGEQLVAALGTDTRAMGQAARRAAQDRFAADRFARDVAGVLHGIADRPRRRRGT